MPFDFSGRLGGAFGGQPQQLWQNYQQPMQQVASGMFGNQPSGMMGGINPSIGALQGMMGRMNSGMGQMQGMAGQMGMGSAPSMGIGPSPSFNMMNPGQMGFGQQQRRMMGG